MSVTVLTALSRVTGLLRVTAVAAAMGTTFLANTYQTANTAPNLVFELLAAGVLTSVFVPTFVDYLVRGEREEGWEAANALTTVALVALIAISILVALAAPLLMRLLLVGVTDPAVKGRSVELGTTFLRLFTPQIVFYGAGMIMTAALHAHRRFAMPAFAPIFNNVVVIGVYLAFIAMTDGGASVDDVGRAETWLLGAGTTMGVVAMTVCLVPPLRRVGWEFRPRFDVRHPAVKKAARLGVWALGYAGGYQAGLVVVLILANRVEGGVAAYQWAYTFFYLPHALFGIPIFHVLFTAMAEHASKHEAERVAERLDEGLATLAFILVPIAGALAVLARPLVELTLQYGVMTDVGADMVATVLMAFALGLPTYSAFLVLTRAYYALSDARTPAIVNMGTVVVAGGLGAVLFFALPDGFAVAGLAAGHSAAFAGGAFVLVRRLRLSLPTFRGSALRPSARRALLGGAASTAAAVAVVALAPGAATKGAAAGILVAAAAAGVAAYAGTMMMLRSPELVRIARLVRGVRRIAP